MRRKQLIFILLALLSVWSCKKEGLNLTGIMENYYFHFASIAEGLQVENPQAVTQSAAEFRNFLQSKDYQNWLNIWEPESRVRHLEIGEDVKKLHFASQKNDIDESRTLFLDIRNRCLECHFINRRGNKREILEGELPMIDE